MPILIPIKTDFDASPEYLLKVIWCKCKISLRNMCGSKQCLCAKNGLRCVSACGDCCGVSCSNVSALTSLNASIVSSCRDQPWISRRYLLKENPFSGSLFPCDKVKTHLNNACKNRYSGLSSSFRFFPCTKRTVQYHNFLCFLACYLLALQDLCYFKSFFPIICLSSGRIVHFVAT